jgi:hypothetical protein
MVNLEVSGMKYIVVNRSENNRNVKLYNLDHSIWKTIDLNSCPLSYHIGIAYDPLTGEIIYDPITGDITYDTTYNYNYDLLYVSENLFNSDNELELMFSIQSSSFTPSFTGIYNENSTLLFSENGAAPLVRLNIPVVFKPIYNTPNGTKMILSFDNGDAKVYNLAGQLVNEIEENNSQTNLNAYPNPTNGVTTIQYSIPLNSKEATISIFNLNGVKLRDYKVDNTFNELKINANELGTGTYMYSISVNGQLLKSEQLLIIE